MDFEQEGRPKDKREIAFNIMACAIVTALLFLLIGCAKTEEQSSNDPSTRWMDRTIYFADPNINDSQRNNFFQKMKAQEAIDEISAGTMLGSGYFNYVQVPESELEPILSSTTQDDFKSFILIWPDSVFNGYVLTKYGSGIPDQNAVTVVNSANKRQFYMIIRASCFEVNSNCNSLTGPGLKALIGRQFGLLTGLQINCTNPQNVMCANPTDLQWSDINKFGFFNSMNNMLENILNTPGFYQ